MTDVHILKRSSEYDLQNRLGKKTLSKLLKYRKMLLTHPESIYGQKTNLMVLYWGEERENIWKEKHFNLLNMLVFFL